MKKIIVIGSVLLLLSGCAYKSEAYSIGKDTYMITGNSDYSAGAARSQAMKGASETCAKQGKVMQVKNVNNYGGGLFLSSDVTFMCLHRGDTDHKRTGLRRDIGTKEVNLNITNK